MNGTTAGFPDIVSSRVEDIYGAPLPEDEVPQYQETLRKAEAALLGLVEDGNKDQALVLLAEISGLRERIRRQYVRFAYLQGMQDGCQLRELMNGKGC